MHVVGRDSFETLDFQSCESKMRQSQVIMYSPHQESVLILYVTFKTASQSCDLLERKHDLVLEY